MLKTRAFSIIFFFPILLASMVSVSFAAAIVGERVSFSPLYPRPGEEVTPIVHFRVEGGPVNLSIGYTATFPSGSSMEGAPKTGNFDTGVRTLQLSRLRIPNPAPYEICLTAKVRFAGATEAQTLVSGACLKKNIRVANAGRGDRRVLRDLPSSTRPDLVVVNPHLSTSHGHTLSPLDSGAAHGRAEVAFGVANQGGTAAEGVEWKVVINFSRCVETVSPFSLERSGIPRIAVRRVGTIPHIAPGETVPVSTHFQESEMTYIDSGGTQRWVPCEITGVKIELDPSNRIREENDTNIFIFPGSQTPIVE